MPEHLLDRLASKLDPDAAITELMTSVHEAEGISLRRHEAMAAHLPLRCGGPADLFAVVEDEDALATLLGAARKAGVKWQLVWPFEELLVRDGGLRGLTVRPGTGFEQLTLLPEDDEPARLLLGSATPWAATRSALSLLREQPDARGGPLATVMHWPGCPGSLLQSGDPAGLEGLVSAVTWRKGRKIERVLVPADAAPPKPSPSAVLLSVELPLVHRPSARRIAHRPAPPPPGTLFGDDGPLSAAPQLRASGLDRTRLRGWRLNNGCLINLGSGDCRTALLLAKGASNHANRKRGIDLTVRIPVIGSDGPRR